MIQVFLRHTKGKQGIKRPRQKKLMPKDEVAKIGPSGLGFQTIQFSRTDRVQLGFEI
jgi:hypothetical protein